MVRKILWRGSVRIRLAFLTGVRVRLLALAGLSIGVMNFLAETVFL